jgi:hypothetical protein
MTNTERIINFCIEYFNKHDVNKDDEPITSDDIYIISYTYIGMGWSAAVKMSYGYVYELKAVDEYGTVVFTKYRVCGDSIYNWEEENSNEL